LNPPYKAAYVWCKGDFKDAVDILKIDETQSWSNPRIRSKEETARIFKQELENVGMRLIKLWPVVEYVAAAILKNRQPIFPRNCTRWSNKIRRCISDREYLKEQAPVASQLNMVRLAWLSTMQRF
jgi:hypothetical protein